MIGGQRALLSSEAEQEFTRKTQAFFRALINSSTPMRLPALPNPEVLGMIDEVIF
jgi:hypothetical protein